jgi:hypothetical protein
MKRAAPAFVVLALGPALALALALAACSKSAEKQSPNAQASAQKITQPPPTQRWRHCLRNCAPLSTSPSPAILTGWSSAA